MSRTALSTLFLLMPSRNRAIQQSLSLTYRYRNTLIGCTRRCQIFIHRFAQIFHDICQGTPTRWMTVGILETDCRVSVHGCSHRASTTSSSSQRYTEPYPMSQTITTAPWKLYPFRFLLGCGIRCWLLAAWGGGGRTSQSTIVLSLLGLVRCQQEDFPLRRLPCLVSPSMPTDKSCSSWARAGPELPLPNPSTRQSSR